MVVQAQLDAEFDRAVNARRDAVQAWQEELKSPVGLLRRSKRRLALWLLASAISWLAASLSLSVL
jgi:hypothetical protein